MAQSLLITLTSLLLCVNFVLSINSDCPPSSKVYTCAPVCYRDSDCAASGGKCCPNLCNQKSCVARHLLGYGGTTDKYGTKPNKFDSGSGSVYCGNVKCSPFEKCELDRNTKREKCVRA